MSTIALSYRDHSAPTSGGAVHGHHVVEQLRRLGHRLITAEPRTDERMERRPRTLRGLGALLDEAELVYLRLQARPWDLALLALNRATRRRPVVIEVNAVPEEGLAYGDGRLRRSHVALLREEYGAMVRSASAVVCVSAALAEYVRERWSVARERIFVVPNGGTPAAEPAPARDDDVFRMVWAGGTRWPWQALDTVLESARRVRATLPRAELVLYGDGALRGFVGEPGVRIERALPHRELQARLRCADVALCLYRSIAGSPVGFYASPLKLFDYMAAGLPVVASRLGQIAEVVEDGVNGFLVGDDPATIADRLLGLACDAPRHRAMGAAALETVRGRYTWDHAGEGLARAIAHALAARGPAAVPTPVRD